MNNNKILQVLYTSEKRWQNALHNKGSFKIIWKRKRMTEVNTKCFLSGSTVQSFLCLKNDHETEQHGTGMKKQNNHPVI